MIEGFDHAAIPMGAVDDMLSFYERLGAEVREEVPGFLYSAYIGANKINLHLPAAWQSSDFTLRGPSARPGCGDFCFVWADTDALQRLLVAGFLDRHDALSPNSPGFDTYLGPTNAHSPHPSVCPGRGNVDPSQTHARRRDNA